MARPAEHLTRLRTCLYCKSVFQRPKRCVSSSFLVSWFSYRRMKFCSLRCRGAWQSANVRGPAHPNWRDRQCIDCGVRRPRNATAKRCWSCHTQHIKKPENNPNWRGGLRSPAKMPPCQDCGKPLGDWYAKHCIKCAGKYRRGPRKAKLTYKYLHTFITQKLGKPMTCTHCGKIETSTRRIHWANRSGNYSRDISDWIRLCVVCHTAYDKRKP